MARWTRKDENEVIRVRRLRYRDEMEKLAAGDPPETSAFGATHTVEPRQRRVM